MKRQLSISLLMMALLIMALPSFALNITIIESQSWDATHTMDAEWAAVATAMGHTPTIMPQSTLDTGAFIPGTDVLIISSGVIPLPSPRMDYIFECVYAGKGVYIQGEAAPTEPGNQAWEFVCNNFSAPFTFTGTMGGVLRPTVHNAIGAEYNAKPTHWYMDSGCFGTYSPGTEGNLRWQANDVGYRIDPLNFPFAGQAIVNTDQDWILTAIDTELMENYIDVLIEQPPLELNLRIGPVGGPINLPSSGGSFDYEVQLNYTGWTSTSFRAWIRLILPSGAVWSPPLVGPTGTITWGAPTTTPLFTFTQFIPAFAPAGTYHVQGVLASAYPSFVTCFDSDNFMFQKLVVAADGDQSEPVEDWASQGSFELAGDSEPVNEAVELPGSFTLADPYPNPFNPSTSVELSLPEAGELTVSVYDLQGREVARLASGSYAAGAHQFSFDASGLASGVYFLRAAMNGDVQTRKLTLMQ